MFDKADGVSLDREHTENHDLGSKEPPEVVHSNPLCKVDLSRTGCSRLCMVMILHALKPVDCSRISWTLQIF